jgi:hypothetical protein
MATVNGSQASDAVAGFESMLISPVLPNAWLVFPPMLFRTHLTGQLLTGTTNGRDAPQEWYRVREVVYLYGPRLVVIATDVYVFVMTDAECGAQFDQKAPGTDRGEVRAPQHHG